LESYATTFSTPNELKMLDSSDEIHNIWLDIDFMDDKFTNVINRLKSGKDYNPIQLWNTVRG